MSLPATGTAALLERLSPFVPDAKIAELLPRHAGGGRRADWSSAQLLRVLLLLVLTPARSTNLLCALLPEQRAWRRFALLPHRLRTPGARQLHEFRRRLCPLVLRALNDTLLEAVLRERSHDQPGIGLFDATDLPAATNEYKKSAAPAASRPGAPRLAAARARAVSPVGLLGTRSIRCACG